MSLAASLEADLSLTASLEGASDSALSVPEGSDVVMGLQPDN